MTYDSEGCHANLTAAASMRDRHHHQLEEVEAGGGGDPVMESRTVPPLLQIAGDKLIERFVPPRSEHQPASSYCITSY